MIRFQCSERSTLSSTLPLPTAGRILRWFCLLLGMILMANSAPSSAAEAASEEKTSSAEKISFNNEIRPILSNNCYFCHGPDPARREADLRLDERQAVIDAYVLVPGKPEESELIRRLETEVAEELMPPAHSNRKVTAAEIAKLKQWIAEGADYQEHWSFKPLQAVTIPEPRQPARIQNPVDAFVLQRLEEQGLTFSPIADRATLLRRVSFALTGLPPSLEELDNFLQDQSSDAYEKAVDRLLASPHYGERMTAEWLDVARYSDTYGYQVDRDRFVWPWRDWVIRAFNRNMPYDQFITEQLAGDLLPNPTDDQILATTFNRLHQQESEGGSVPEEYRIEYIADRTQTFGTAFLGLTIECARCHTHKYDPITQREYFQLSAFFDNIDEAGLYSYFTDSVPTPTLMLKTPEHRQKLAELEQKVQEAEQHYREKQKASQADFERWLHEGRFQIAQQRPLSEKSTTEDSTAKESTGDDSVSSLIPNQLAALDFESFSGAGNESVAGPSGKAVRLTGDDVINLEVGNFRRFEPFSVSLWMNTPDLKERAVIFHRSRAWTDAASRGYELLLVDGHLQASLIHFWPGNAVSVRTKEPFPVQKWSHVTITYDGSSQAAGLQIWVDGQRAVCEVVRDQLTKQITGGGGDYLAIGERFRDRGFKGGQVDEFQVYQRELTDLEVAQLFDQNSLQAALSTPVEQLSATTKQFLRQYYFSTQHAELQKELQTARQNWQTQRQLLCELQDSIPEIMVMREMPEPKPSYLLNRGVYDARDEQVFPDTMAAFPEFPKQSPRNRLGLAQWVTSPQNPLTARVTVNRYWQMLFSEGLVRTPEDFGSQGAAPTHPELLDWLAFDFLTHDWDVKRLLKQMVLSTTFQQASTVSEELLAQDPENRLLTRFPAHRLSAEMLRDMVLASSGLLVDELGGPPVKPYEVEASFKPIAKSSGSGLYRRSLYTYWKRTAPAPVMMTLDANSRDVCRVKREKTTSPLQALVMLNGPQYVEAGRALAEQAWKQTGQNSQQALELIFRSLTARTPTPEELQVLQELWRSQQENFAKHPAEAVAYLKVGEQPYAEDGNPAELAALSVIAITLFNFDESLRQR